MPRQTSWGAHGALTQYYRRGVGIDDSGRRYVYQSEIDTDLDLTTETRGDGFQVQGRFTGGYANRLTDDGVDDPLHISSLYIDAADTGGRNELRLGRQTPDRGGVLGPFDGLSYSRRLSPRVRLNLVGGFPMDDSTLDRVMTATRFHGINADLGTYGGRWDFNAFAIEQYSEDLLDRRAVGGQVRYTRPNGSVTGLADYDISYRTLNLLLLMGNWRLPDRTEIKVVYDQRKSPILTTRNALIGQGATSLGALSRQFSEDEIRALARDRSADSRSYTLSAMHPLSERVQIGGDVTLSTVAATPASGGVAATAASGDNWSYGLHLMGSDLVKRGDGAAFELRHETHEGCDSWSVNLDTHYPINGSWYVNPVVHVDRYHYGSDGGSQWSLLPTLRVSHQIRRNLSLAMELGGQWTRQPGGSLSAGYYMSFGYQATF